MTSYRTHAHFISEAGVTAGSSARVSEQRKHASNDEKCSELVWSCIPLPVETYRYREAYARLNQGHYNIITWTGLKPPRNVIL